MIEQNEAKQLLVNSTSFELILQRLVLLLNENHYNFQNTLFIALQPRGVFLGRAITEIIKKSFPDSGYVMYGELDVTFYRDDVTRQLKPILPSPSNMQFDVDGKKVVLVDDVLYTGRTIRSGIDAILDYGRPDKIELLVLVDRLYSRELPIQPDYYGIKVDTINSERVMVDWENEKKIWLLK